MVEFNENITDYFHAHLLKVFCDASLSRLWLLCFLPIKSIVAGLIYLPQILTKLLEWNLTLWARLATYSIQSHMVPMIRNPGRQMGKNRRFLPSEQFITVPSWKTSCNGARTRSKTGRRASALVCLWTSSAGADSSVNFGDTGSNARSKMAILAGLFLVRERILLIVKYTGQAFLSPEKLVS